QGFACLLRRDLTDPAGLLGGSAQVRQRRRRRRGGSCRFRRGRRRRLRGRFGRRLLGFRGGEHILLADASADAGTLHCRQVNVVLGGERSHQRGDIRATIARRRLRHGLGLRFRFGLGFRLGLGDRLWLGFGFRFRLGFGDRLWLGFRFWLRLGRRLFGRRSAFVADLGELAADGDRVVLLGGDG